MTNLPLPCCLSSVDSPSKRTDLIELPGAEDDQWLGTLKRPEDHWQLSRTERRVELYRNTGPAGLIHRSFLKKRGKLNTFSNGPAGKVRRLTTDRDTVAAVLASLEANPVQPGKPKLRTPRRPTTEVNKRERDRHERLASKILRSKPISTKPKRKRPGKPKAQWKPGRQQVEGNSTNGQTRSLRLADPCPNQGNRPNTNGPREVRTV